MIARIRVSLLLTILLLIILLNRMPNGFGGLRGYALLRGMLVSRLHYDVG